MPCARSWPWRPGWLWCRTSHDPGVESTRYFDLEAEYLNSHGLTARFFEPEDLHEAWDCPAHLRYPLGLRNFTMQD